MTLARLLSGSALLLLATTANAALPTGNPFAAESTLPYHAPPFDRIKDADFQPAFEQGIADQTAETRKIADNPAAPTFDNTVVAMERSGALLARFGR